MKDQIFLHLNFLLFHIYFTYNLNMKMEAKIYKNLQNEK